VTLAVSASGAQGAMAMWQVAEASPYVESEMRRANCQFEKRPV
jgi:hypothetical protein